MYHSKTPEQIKQKVLSSLLEENGTGRIVIATSALRMSVMIIIQLHGIYCLLPTSSETEGSDNLTSVL